jgi:hypothetical protein
MFRSSEPNFQVGMKFRHSIRNSQSFLFSAKESDEAYYDVAYELTKKLFIGMAKHALAFNSTKYDIYVDFVPPAIDGNSRATEKTCLSYRMKVEQENGRTKYENRQGKNDEELIVGGDSVGDVYMKTVKVWSAYQFPTSDFYDAMWYLDEGNADKVNEISPKTTLEIKTNVTNAELNVKYVRRFRIDRIRFVPAKNN